MSLFTALNFTPDDALQEAEQHSRELQVEESSKIYQSALLHLKAKRFEQAEEKFKELFNIDVIKPDKWGLYKYSSPTLNSLRYLAYRNRGVFYYQFLQEKHENMSSQDIVEYTLKVAENLLDAIQHSNCDAAVAKLLISIFKSFRSVKLQRYTLEYELLKECGSTTALKRKKTVLPEVRDFIHRYVELLRSSEDTGSLESDFIVHLKCLLKSSSPLSLELPPFLSRIQTMKLEDDLALREENEVSVVVNELSWEAVAEAVVSTLPKYKFSNFFSKISDPYNEAEEPIEKFKFVLNDLHNEVEVDVEEEHSEHGEQANLITEDDTKNVTAPEDTPGQEGINQKRPLDAAEVNKPLQRMSKRFKEKPQVASDARIMDNHEKFLQVINDVALSTGYDLILTTDKLAPQDVPKEAPYFNAISDLYDCISSWTNKHSEFLNQTDTKNSKSSSTDVESTLQLNALIRTSVLAGDNAPIESLTDLPADDIQSFINRINKDSYHFQEVRLMLLDSLLSTDTDGRCLIIDTFWSPVLFKTVEFLVMSVETNLFNMIGNAKSGLGSLGLSAYEILINMLGNIYSNISTKKLQGQKVNELETQKNKLERKISRWTLLLEELNFDDERSFYRFLWAKFCSLQYSTDITDGKLVLNLQEIESKIGKNGSRINVPYSNYSTIPHLNLKAVQSQLSRLKIIQKLTSIDVDVPQEDNDVATKQQMELIRKALVSDEYMNPETSSEEELSMESFLRNSPFLLKVKLWRLLVSFYSQRDKAIAQAVYFKILRILYERLCSDEYGAQSQLQRQQTLLLTISCIGSFTRGFVEMVQGIHSNSSKDNNATKTNLHTLFKILRILYPIVFFESLCQKDSNLKSFFRKAVKSSTKLKSVFTDTITSIIYMCSLLEREQTKISSLVEVAHEILGSFDFCDASEGSFLHFAEQLLCKQNNEGSFNQIKQLLWCQYHLLIGGDSSAIEQHNTKGQVMTQDSAVALGKFLINSHYGDRNPLSVSGNKTNLKQTLDSIIQVVGDVDISANYILSRNEFFLEQYLKSVITANTFRKAYAGKLSLQLVKPNDKLQGVADLGLFFVASIQALNLYKARKKATQARPSELDSVISTLKTDILYNTERFESWMLLGKCYSYIVEDDLIWTSDKLATSEKRKGTTSIQRKAILCYLMALGLAMRSKGKFPTSSQVSDYQDILKELFETLSEEILNGYLKPMEASCFQWEPPTSVKLTVEGELAAAQFYATQTVSDFNIQQAILTGFSKAIKIEASHLASKNRPKNWKNLYYTAKIIFKRCAEEYKTDGLNILLQACSVCDDATSSKELILEPHYFLTVSCFKLVKGGFMTPQQALLSLQKNNSIFQKDDDFWLLTSAEASEEARHNFCCKIVALLRALIAMDKMKWHHRPRYRIARILYEEMHDLDGAISEMDELMFLKSSNKSLVNIWKPKYERPGKHFIYTFQYVIFYLDLLFCRNDYSSIALVAKKLKRFGPGMVNVATAADRAMRLFCQSVQDTFGVNEKLALDKTLPSLNYQQFLRYSDLLFQSFDKTKYDSKVLDTLVHALQLKKGNNGYDGICLALYFTFIYLPWASQKEVQDKSQTSDPNMNNKAIEPTQEPPNGLVKGKASTNRKRVSKKDAFDKISALVEKRIT
ncbi:Hir3p [Lachancea thermotolerans CBS 6340]|uniref:KLTH0D17424p n=1 Tax=Lachancea thermotolerans (strain ATCC 56472 / CBS 6340 / NRRL Y-8284) TaxID=559295 RepID=C5DFS0_LACTC|nr:KLTH0D17424p [Lachancea thermotolerans CBS 6340]CAR23025.1 KLTH0D17424p [Lachancea thermotolerans CBS 6340]